MKSSLRKMTNQTLSVMGVCLRRYIAWHSSVRILRETYPLAPFAFAGGVALAIAFPQGNCTCEDQIPDARLQALAAKGNQEVQRYLKQEDNAMLCAAKRAALLKSLNELKKQSTGGP